MGKTIAPLPPGNLENINLRDALEQRYLAYALSTIMERALPDARDGLKPVHRRILYGMQILRLDPGTAFKKCAKIVGDVMGSFHPHGDQAIYDALVRLAQDFSSRYPLIEGQGNFGNIDGDSAAAYRYTEARMTEIARLLLQGIDEDSIDFKDNYSGDQKEPIVLPAAIPNLLANGAQGIAVGMATSVPPHNLGELCDAALYLILHKDAATEQLMTFAPGPDFPTGGIIVEPPESLLETYKSGRGSIRLRARWSVEEGQRGQWNVVITEIPYMVQKSRLIEKIAELHAEKKLPLVGDIRDESAEDVRVVIEPKTRSIEPAIMMESLFRLTELETRFPVNMNLLVDGVVPRVVPFKDALRQWLDHRRNVLLRRTAYRLRQIAHRLEVLEGMLIAFLNLDEVIRIIREEDEPKETLKLSFSLSEVQANYILDTRLRSLRRLEEMELRNENEKLIKERSTLTTLLNDEIKQWKSISSELRDLKKRYGPETKAGARRSDFAIIPDLNEVDFTSALIEREPVSIIISVKGWIRALKGHIADLSSLQFKADDHLHIAFFTETTSKILVLSNDGKVFTLETAKLPSGRGHGEPIRLMADIDEAGTIVTAFAYEPGRKMLVAASDGRGFVVSQNEMVGTTRKGKLLLNVEHPARLALILPVIGDHLAIIGENRRLLIFPTAQIPELARGKGVKLQKYHDGGCVDAKFFNLADGLSWRDSSGRSFKLNATELGDWIGNRADIGRLPPRGFPKNNRFG